MDWGRTHRTGPGPTPRRAAAHLIALVAVFLQAFAVQTHVHAAAPDFSAAVESAAISAGPAAENITTSDAHALACVLCQALSSPAIAPAPAAEADVHAAPNAQAPPLHAGPAIGAHTHSWRSRAPPASL